MVIVEVKNYMKQSPLIIFLTKSEKEIINIL